MSLNFPLMISIPTVDDLESLPLMISNLHPQLQSEFTEEFLLILPPFDEKGVLDFRNMFRIPQSLKTQQTDHQKRTLHNTYTQ